MNQASRFHLFELHDQTWFPAFMRDELTHVLASLWSLDLPPFLSRMLCYTPAYKIIGSLVIDSLNRLSSSPRARSSRRTKNNRNPTHNKSRIVVDVCSGAGGPVPKMANWVNDQLNKTEKCSFVLTDLYPNESAIEAINGKHGCVEYNTASIDACNLPPHLSTGLRTSFGSFHHLPEDVATNLVQDVVKNKAGLLIVEGTGRDMFHILNQFFVISSLSIFVALFQNRPMTLKRLLAIPFLPFIVMIDGVLSCLRTYEAQDYWRILNSVEGAWESHTWELHHINVMDFNKSFLGSFWLGRVVAMVLGKFTELRVLVGISKVK